MKRAAFTMIELIFVIVILGILAAVAIPKLAGVQDDALVSSENTGIASARSGVAAIRGRLLSRPGIDVNISTSFIDGTTGLVTLDGTPTSTVAADKITTARFPYSLSVAAAPTASGGTVTPIQTIGEGTGLAMAMVLEPEGRESWKTKAVSGNTSIAGPATGVVIDSSAQLNTSGSWRYDPSTGIFSYQSTTAF